MRHSRHSSSRLYQTQLVSRNLVYLVYSALPSSVVYGMGGVKGGSEARQLTAPETAQGRVFATHSSLPSTLCRLDLQALLWPSVDLSLYFKNTNLGSRLDLERWGFWAGGRPCL